MIVYNDTTQLQIAKEASWAVDSGLSFKTMPFLRDNLAPNLVRERPQGLGQTAGQVAPIVVEQSAGGDLELLASRDHVGFMLPYMINHDGVSHDVNLDGQQASASGDLSLSFLDTAIADYLIDHDVVLIKTSAGASWATVTRDRDGELSLSGLEADKSFIHNDQLIIRSYVPDTHRSSFCLVKSFRGVDDRLTLHGCMMQRLTLDLDEGTLPAMTATVLAKNMTVTHDPITATPLSTTASSIDLSGLTLTLSPDTGDALSLNNTIVTGFRLVMERVGMGPQFALGNTAPRYITNGDMVVQTRLLFTCRMSP